MSTNDLTEITNLIALVEANTAPDEHIDALVHDHFGTGTPLQYTGSINAAMALLPKRSCNALLMQMGKGWNFRFHDQDQTMGARAASEEIERMICAMGDGSGFSGPARVMLEKAISSHFLEFYCMHAETPEGAIISAALKCKIRLDLNTELFGSES